MTDRCPRCRVRLVSGKALRNTLATGAPDFEGSRDLAGQTMSYSGPAVLDNVLKCPRCGYSRTYEAPKLPGASN